MRTGVKSFFIGLLILSSFSTFAQTKKGFIVDPDGYTNVRESGSTDSKIITRSIEGEIFNYEPTDNSWFSVTTYKGAKGFVHKSRIEEFKISKNLCLNENFSELLLFRKSGKIISVCGSFMKRIGSTNFYSGLLIGDGLNKIKFQEFPENGFQSFELNEGQIYIYEYTRLPIDKDFNTDIVPFSISRTFFIGERIFNITRSDYYDFPKLSDESIVRLIDKLKGKTIKHDDFYNLINKALVFALNNKKLGEDFLYNLESRLDIVFDGEYGEKYRENLLIYEINKNNR